MIGKDESSRRARLAAGICPSTGLSGAAVPARFPLVGAAVTAGEVGVREAALICSTITGFPRHHPPTVVEAAEQFLVDQAAVLDPKTFKQTAREIALMANPDGTPDDRDAHEKMEFHLGQRREDGLTRCWGLLDDLTAEALRAAFGSMCSPSAERRNDRVDVQWPSDGDGGTDGVPGGIDPDATGPDVPAPSGRSDREDDAAQPFLPDLGDRPTSTRTAMRRAALMGPPPIVTSPPKPTGPLVMRQAAPPIRPRTHLLCRICSPQATITPTMTPPQRVPECGDAASGQSETDQPPTSRSEPARASRRRHRTDGRPPDPPPDRAQQ